MVERKSKAGAVAKGAASATADRKSGSAMTYYMVLLLIYGSATSLSLYRLWWVPEPLPAGSSRESFSEERALRHVKALSDMGQRLAGQPEIDVAARYLVGEGEKLAKLAKQTRPDLLVQVAREQVTGAVATSLLNTEFINMYSNLSNVIIAVSPIAALREKSVLVSAHFDSTLSTEGASDDASSVGVALEVARALVAAGAPRLAAPIVFLLNGGEEALCPAAHGFMQTSPWARDLGVFINLESTGPLGPDIVFQHTGNWPMQAYAAVAPFPRGSVVAQDFFELGVIPADTDYRMFSSKLQGRLPGLDTAFLLGAGMYHTDRDRYNNIRRGTLQAMGQNALAAVEELAKQLALRTSAGAKDSATEKTIFFDVLGLFMVVYPFSWARIVHTTPLVLALSLPLLQRRAFGQRSLASVYAAVFVEAVAGIFSVVSAVLACTFAGVLRVTALGAPMAWYGSEVAPFLILVPATLGGLMLPYLGRRLDPVALGLGTTLAYAAGAAGLTAAGLGTSFVCVIWAIAGLITMTDLELSPRALLLRATINSVWPLVLLLPNAIAFAAFILQKSSFIGAQGQPDFTPIVADAIAGAIVGLSTVSVTGSLAPWAAYASGRGLRRTVLLLFCASALAAAHTSLLRTPYTADAPKKVPIQHIHEHDASGRILRSVFAVGSVDSVPVDGLLKGADAALWAAERSGWEYLTLYPMGDKYIQSRVLQAPPPRSPPRLPLVELLERTQAPGGGGAERLRLQLHLPAPNYIGCLQFSGRILDWSLPRLATLRKDPGQPHDRFVRFAGDGPPEDWRFVLDLPAGEALRVRVAAADPRGSPDVTRFVSGWPEWTFVINLLTYASTWTF